MRVTVFVPLLFASVLTVANAHCQTIANLGETVSAIPYLGTTQPRKAGHVVVTGNAHQTLTTSHVLYPSHSPLTPGKEATRALPATFSALPPFFIVGPDHQSVQWLTANAGVLKGLHVMGYVTNVDNAETLHSLTAQTHTVLMVASLDALVDQLGIHHYPVLVANGWIVQ